MFGDADTISRRSIPVSTVSFNSFLVLANFFGRKNGRNTYIHALEIVERYTIFLRINILRRLYRQICLFGRRSLSSCAWITSSSIFIEKQLGRPIR